MPEYLIAQPIDEKSWVHDVRFAKVKAGLVHAATQSVAIPALSKLTPEEAALLFISMTRGAEKETESDSPAQVLRDLFPLIVDEENVVRRALPAEFIRRIGIVLGTQQPVKNLLTIVLEGEAEVWHEDYGEMCFAQIPKPDNGDGMFATIQSYVGSSDTEHPNEQWHGKKLRVEVTLIDEE